MPRQFLMFAALAIAAAAPAVAQDRPSLRPSRDVAVEYRSSGPAQGPAARAGGLVTMRFASNGDKIRVDGSNGHGYAIFDAGTGRMIIVMTQQHMYMERPADPSMMPMLQATNGTFVKTGTDTVAGLSCTTYDASFNDRKGNVCVTGDGVLLRARGTDPDRGELEAVTVTYGDQPAALFEPPSDFQNFDIPEMPRGGMSLPPGVGGQPPGGLSGH